MEKPVLKPVLNAKQIAPCGMNCGSCLAYLREKNRCHGCRTGPSESVKTRYNCRIRNCEALAGLKSGYCYDCDVFPCRRLKDLDKRYRTRYHTSFISNLLMIKLEGMKAFLAFESARRTCPACGSVLCVHRDKCPSCAEPVSYNAQN